MPWVKSLLDRGVHEAAAATGTRIVPCCGYDSIPFDMGAFLVATHLKCARAPGGGAVLRGTGVCVCGGGGGLRLDALHAPGWCCCPRPRAQRPESPWGPGAKSPPAAWPRRKKYGKKTARILEAVVDSKGGVSGGTIASGAAAVAPAESLWRAGRESAPNSQRGASHPTPIRTRVRAPAGFAGMEATRANPALGAGGVYSLVPPEARGQDAEWWGVEWSKELGKWLAPFVMQARRGDGGTAGCPQPMPGGKGRPRDAQAHAERTLACPVVLEHTHVAPPHAPARWSTRASCTAATTF